MATRSDGKPIVLVTGSAGLIGSRTVEALSSDYVVVGMDVKRPGKDAAADFIDCDLTKDESVARALDAVREKHGDRVASVIHLAAYYDFSGKPSDMYRKLTVEGTSRLLKKLQGFRTEQFVFSSSLLVMEPAEEEGEKITESSPLEDEPWAYPRSKIEAEQLLRRERAEIPTVILRIAGVYDDDCHSIPIAQHIGRIHEKSFESYFFPGDASHGQAFVHLDDLMTCLQKAVQLRRELKNELFLIAEPEVMSYAELQEQLGELIHGAEWPTLRIPKAVAKAGAWVQEKAGKETFIKPWMVDLADAHYPVAIGHAREKLGWEPKHTLRGTLPEIIRRFKRDPKKWYEENGLETPEDKKEKEEKERKAPEQVPSPGVSEKARTAVDLDVNAPPWKHNPSSWRARVPICLLAGVAFLVATYMALYQWRLIGGVWDPVFGEQSRHVLDSEVSERMRRWLRVPDAAFGALAYLGDLIFGLAGSTRRWQYRPWLVVLFGLDVIPLGIVSAVLVILQGTMVGAWCFLCLVTAAISLALVALAYDEVWSTLLYIRRVWRKTRSASIVWDVFWGRASREADEVALAA